MVLKELGTILYWLTAKRLNCFTALLAFFSHTQCSKPIKIHCVSQVIHLVTINNIALEFSISNGSQIDTGQEIQLMTPRG